MATFTNQATLTYNGISTTSNIATGELVEVLSATKSALNSTYSSGGTVTYSISIRNSGTTDFTGLTVSDNLGTTTFGTGTVTPLTYSGSGVQYYINGVLQAAPTVATGTSLTITGISVPAGGNTLLIYETAVNSYAPLDTTGSITNVVTISGNGLATPITASQTVTAAPDPTLSISKSISPATVSENGTLTYTFVIENSGNTAAEAADDVALSDTFDPILSGLTVTFNGTAWTAGTQYTYNQTTGLLTTTAGQITVPAATYTQNPTTGEWTINPGISTLVITGTV